MRRVNIVQGEQYVSNEPQLVISTLLGSCVAVCLHDAEARIGGMNHFLLGEPAPGARVDEDQQQRYGIHAMELLINALMSRGASRARLRARLYGGANIISGLGAIGSRNAAFAQRFMELENIAVVASNLGGCRARKVEFMPYEGRVRSFEVNDVPIPAPPVPTPAPAGGDIELF